MFNRSKIAIEMLLLAAIAMIIIQCSYSQDEESIDPEMLSKTPSAISYEDISESTGTLYPYSGIDNPLSNDLSILFDTEDGWKKFAQCPRSHWVSMRLYLSTKGEFSLIEIYPDLFVKRYTLDCETPGYNRLWYFCNDAGRHTVFIMTNNTVSKAAIIFVK